MKKLGIRICNSHNWSSFFHMTAFIRFLVIRKVKKELYKPNKKPGSTFVTDYWQAGKCI